MAFLKTQYDKSKAELEALNMDICRREAHEDAALAALRRDEKRWEAEEEEEEAKKKKKHKSIQPTQAPRMTSASRSVAGRPRSPQRPGLVAKEKTKKMAAGVSYKALTSSDPE